MFPIIQPPPYFNFLALITPVDCLAHVLAQHRLGKAKVNSPSLTAYLRGWKDFSTSEHIRSTLLSSPFTSTNKGMPHTQKPTWVSVVEGTTMTVVTDLHGSCFFADSASVCLPVPVHGPASLPLPTNSVSCSIFIFQSHFPLAPSFCQLGHYLVTLETYYFIFFSRTYTLLWICLIKLPAFAGGPVNFSRHCLTTDLSSNIKQKQETEYRVWILFTKPRAGFSPGNAMCLHVPSATWTYSQALQGGALSEAALLAEG